MDPVTPPISKDRSTGGELLRSWRRRHGLSQLELSLETGVSSRHISCIETGRATPSRSMILRLATHLEIPLREQNRILVAAGYAPAYQQTPLDGEALGAAREAIERVMQAHEPFPALVFTTSRWLVGANGPLWWLLDGLPDHVLAPPVNVMRVALHPDGLITRVRNPAAWYHYMYGHLRRQAGATGDPDLLELVRELGSYPIPDAADDERSDRETLFETLRFHHRGQDLDFISTLATFGTPLDLTPAELIIESLYPANSSTARAMSEHATSGRSDRASLIGGDRHIGRSSEARPRPASAPAEGNIQATPR